jgi:hypothetical protein
VNDGSVIDSAARTVDYNALCDAITQADVQVNEDVAEIIRTDYSGRGMYGAECFGLVCDLPDVMATLVMLSHASTPDSDEVEWDVVELSRRMCSDGMGLSSIFYFPGWTLTNVPQDDGEQS